MTQWLDRLLRLLRIGSRPEPVGDPERPHSDHVYETLQCVDRAGRSHSCTLGWADGPLRDVQVMVPDRGLQVDAQEIDLFGAFLEVRKKLEKKGLRLVCAGARLDCWPSGMARQMGMGETAYVLVPGQPADVENRIYLFAPAEPEQVGTVREQAEAYRRWLDSVPDEDEGEGEDESGR